MELTIRAWYNEPEINFEFSHRISNYIRLVIKDSVMKPLGLIENYPEKFLHLSVTTTSTQDKLEVKMGPFKTKSTSVNCGLWFPYKQIMTSPHPLDLYVENYIESIPLIFKRWGVTEEQVKEAGKKIRAEILNNPYYELTQEEKNTLEESKKITDRIKREMNL
jgi:hypothetical protein